MSGKVAIITPSFNRAYIIEKTAESVFAQTYGNWEWIIVDDGSSDKSWELIQSFARRDSRVKAIQRSRYPKGACTCRNIAVENTDADWLVFLDSDDLLHPQCIMQRLEKSQSSREMQVLYFPTLLFQNDTNDCHLWDDYEHPVNWLESVLTMAPPCPGTGTFWSRAIWNQCGGWNEDLGIWQDIELHARAHWKGVEFKAVPDAFPDVYIRISADSISRVDFHSREKLESRLLVIQECWTMIQKKGATEAERKALASMTLSALRNGASLSLFSEMKTLLKLPQVLLTKDESALAFRILRNRRWKLDKIQQVHLKTEERWSQCFPPSGRKLGKHRWTPNHHEI